MARFNFNHHRLLTGDMGFLYPAGLVEVLPGDVVRHGASTFVRLAPMAAPMMHPVTCRVDHVFVPHRIVWPKDYECTWEEFITGGPNNDEATPLPTLTVPQNGAKNLLDYLGIPPDAAGLEVSDLPVRAFNATFNYLYRDADLVPVRDPLDLSVPRVAWEKDYFSTARPWAQKGPEVTIPIGDTAPVVTDGTPWQVNDNEPVTLNAGSVGRNDLHRSGPLAQADTPVIWGANSGLIADLSQAVSAKANDIRRAFALQRFAENRARAGSRLAEYTLQAFGVRTPDARLQEPEYLGGGRTQISVSEVLQTANEPGQSDERFGVGDMYGHGLGLNRSNSYRARFTEHGYILTLVSIRPKAIYASGVERTWLRRDRMDFLQRELQFIGEQQVTQPEVWTDGTNQDVSFGFVPRYQEYRYQRSTVAGEFRGSFEQPLDYWHMARQFDGSGGGPALNEQFVNCDATKRIYNVQDSHGLYMAVQHNMKVRRKMVQVATGRII